MLAIRTITSVRLKGLERKPMALSTDEKMIRHKIKRIGVTQGKKFAGIISTKDIT